MSKTPKDPFFNIKFKAFCLQEGKHPEKDGMSFSEFVNYAKFQLAETRGYLLKDPIWDSYSDEELLIEYFAILYNKDVEQRDKFKREVLGINEENDFDWMDRMVQKNQKELKNMVKEFESSEDFAFKPDSMDGDD